MAATGHMCSLHSFITSTENQVQPLSRTHDSGAQQPPAAAVGGSAGPREACR